MIQLTQRLLSKFLLLDLRCDQIYTQHITPAASTFRITEMEAKIDRMEVLKEDQDRINTFSKLNNKVHDLTAQLKAKSKWLEDLEDAGNE